MPFACARFWTLGRERGRLTERQEYSRIVAALVAALEQQADRIAWLEGEVAGWRIKLAECEERQR